MLPTRSGGGSGRMSTRRLSEIPEVELTRRVSDQWARPIDYRDGDGGQDPGSGSDNGTAGADRAGARRRPGRGARRQVGPGGLRVRGGGREGGGSRAEGRDGYVVALNRAMSEYPDDLREQVESYLEGMRFSQIPPTEGLEDAMRYSLLAGGKRIRPVLALATARAVGMETADVLPLAAAIELIHTYSLIHDDLPAMDDDELRRGRPTCHVVYGEGVAILAGDGLYAEAFHHLLAEQSGAPDRVLAAARELAAATGVVGMVGGQYLDVAQPREPTNGDIAELRRLHELKTGRLIEASVECVLLLADAPQPATIALRAFASELGVLFQIVDDILDVTGTDSDLGKMSGSDERLGKLTYVSAHGLDGARELAGESHAKARAALAGAGELRSG